MAEYKDMTKLKKEISDVKRELWESSCQSRSYITGYVSALSYVEGMIASLPATDVEPVKREKWEVVRTHNNFIKHMYKCPACEKNQFARSNYCPNCGAKMDGKEVQE